MSSRKSWLAALGIVFGLGLNAISEPGAKVCVVCGETVSGNHAVNLAGRAYWIHAYPCEARWRRAEAIGRFAGLESEIPPGSELFDGIAAGDEPSGSLTAPGGALWFWGLFYFIAASLSGGLGCLFAVLLKRNPVAGFLLGILLPAVGMVLVPVLPRRRGSVEPTNAPLS
jgi:hypothetical protein